MSIISIIGVFFFSVILGAIAEYKFKLFFWTIMVFSALFTTAVKSYWR
jgi:Zn-dependent protease with chaperone function